MYNCSVSHREVTDGLDKITTRANSESDDRVFLNETKEDAGVLENKKKKLEVKYMQCLKMFYLKNELMNNNCDIYVKEYEKINKYENKSHK